VRSPWSTCCSMVRQRVAGSPESLAAIGDIVGLNADDIKEQMLHHFETLAKSCFDAITAATDKGPHRCRGARTAPPSLLLPRFLCRDSDEIGRAGA
jgi:hypothetical protein